MEISANIYYDDGDGDSKSDGDSGSGDSHDDDDYSMLVLPRAKLLAENNNNKINARPPPSDQSGMDGELRGKMTSKPTCVVRI